jgi:DNA-3-methyladenine glycosylase II
MSSMNAARLRRAGLSRQKRGYLKDLARRVASGRLALDALDDLPDEAVIEALTSIRGVGVWTAQVFLMFRLGRLDVLPVLDLGIRKGMQRTYALRRMPTPARMERIAAGWSPLPQRRVLVPLEGGRGPAPPTVSIIPRTEDIS